MSVIAFPASGLSEADFRDLQGEGYRRTEKGLAGYVTRGYNAGGRMWAAILKHPNGPPLHHVCREQGVYYVLNFSEDGQSHMVDAHRSFDDVLRHLPERAPQRSRAKIDD